MRESRPGVVQAMSLRRWERYILKKALADMVGEREEEWYHGSKLSSLWGRKFFYMQAPRALSEKTRR